MTFRLVNAEERQFYVRYGTNLIFLSFLSQVSPKATLGVGTFYDFFNRLWLASFAHLTGRNKRKLKKPRKKGKKNEKMAPRNPKITEKLVNRALREKNIHYAPKAHDLL